MTGYVIRRLLYGVLILIGVNLFTFVLFFAINTPDDMARLAIGGQRVSQDAIEKWKTERGYDKPLFLNTRAEGAARYTDTVFYQRSVPLLAMDFGASDGGRDIGREIRTRMGPSLALALPTFVLGLFASVVFSLTLVYFRATRLDFWGVVLCVVLLSISSLFYIIAGQWLFSKLLRLAPYSRLRRRAGHGQVPGGARGGGDHRPAGARGALLPHAVSRGNRQGLCTHRPRQGPERVGRAVSPCAAQRHAAHPHGHGIGHSAAVHGQPDRRVLLRHSRPGQLHHRRHQRAGFLHRPRHGVPGVRALYRGPDLRRYFVHAGRPRVRFE